MNDPVAGQEIAQACTDISACCRLIAHFGWDDLVYGHVSVRLSGDRVLFNPGHLRFDEVMPGDVLSPGAAGGHPVNPTGPALHRPVYAARPDVNCIIHVHAEPLVAVSVLPEGLLPVSQDALLLQGRIGYHAYSGIFDEDDGSEPYLVADLGDHRCLLMENHGGMTVGGNVAEAFMTLYHLVRACEIQLAASAAAGGGSHLKEVPLETRKTVSTAARPQGMDAEWAALLRLLD